MLPPYPVAEEEGEKTRGLPSKKKGGGRNVYPTKEEKKKISSVGEGKGGCRSKFTMRICCINYINKREKKEKKGRRVPIMNEKEIFQRTFTPVVEGWGRGKGKKERKGNWKILP